MLVDMVRRYRVVSVAVCLLLSWLWRGSEGQITTYTPVYGTSSETSYDATSGSSRFPDVPVILDENSQYFINELNFDAISGKILVGAADNLYQLSTDLDPEVQYTWETNANSLQTCQNSAESSTFACRNHIRVYKKIPGNPDLLLICGTQSAEVPQCRTLNIATGDVDGASQSAVKNATDGMISYYPFFNGFGDFRADEPSDPTYLTAGFFDGSSGIGRHFSISYQNITFTDPVNPDTLTLTERFSTIRDNSYWLRNPVTFVDFIKTDYPIVPDATSADDYKLYFLFLRERLNVKFNTFDILSSRVVRICRNDPGSTMTGDQQYFLTYMKARIYCNQRVPDGRENVGAIDYLYDELMSVSFNDDMGRFVQTGTWNRNMYGAFSSSAVGPKASAICIYDAANTRDPAVVGDGNGMGIFDIFRGNVIEAIEDNALPDVERPNFFFECVTDTERTNEEARNQVIVANDVLQAIPDPLLVLPDVYITKMVVDQVCVVTRDDPAICVNQDILFLATDTGKVLKVVFGLDSNDNSFPVVVEEIELDDDNEVSQMEIQEVGGVKYIFVSTSTKVYRFPLQRCSRHATCIDCIGSRDPYCIWNTGNSQCEEATMLSAVEDANGVVNSGMYRQNIHTGMDPATCSVSPVCDLSVSALGAESIQVEIQCNGTSDVTICIPTLNVNETMTLEADGTATNTYPGSRGLQTHEVIVKTDAGTGPGSGPTFSDSVTTPAGAPVPLDADQIYADDVSATSFRVTVIPDIFTDDFENYEFRVSYTPESQGLSVSGYQALTVSHSMTITGLPDSDEVTYSVELRNSVGSVMISSLSVDLRDSTPGAVQNLMVTDITEESVTLEWTEPAETNGDIDGYDISWNGGRDLSVSGTTTTITGLTPSVVYNFDVQACNDAGCGANESVSATTECAVAEQVVNFQFDSVTASSLSYTWNPPAVVNGNPAAVTYNVRSICYLPIDGARNATLDSSMLTSGSITDLEPLTYCCVTVTAVNTCNIDGTPASVLGLEYVQCQRTDDITPGMVRNLTITALSPTSLLAVWNPPANYERPGVTYTITVTSSGINVAPTFSILDQTSYFIDNLMANTEYSVAVNGESGAGAGNAVSVDRTTAPSAPNPPTSPALSFADPGDLTRLTFTWVDATRDAFSVTMYAAVVRCNEYVNSTEVSSTVTTVDFVVDDPGSDFAWCTGQVQAVNNIGRSEFSELANVVVPSRVPSQPRCFLTDDFGSAVNISFTVTDPFSLSTLTVMYTLESDVQPMATESYEFNVENGTNDVIVQVTRNTVYDFQLVLCNVAGCSQPCQELRNFTTSTSSPRPPTVIDPLDITTSTVNVTWEVPLFENEDTIEYTVQVSGTTTEPVFVEGLTQRWYVFEGLAPERLYTAAIRVRDIESNVTGIFGPAGEFTTLSGVPSEPRFISASFEEIALTQTLRVVYGVPQNTNGTLTLYEILWAGSSSMDCDNPEGVMQMANQTDLEINGFNTTDVGNINSSSALLVCVRAYTQETGIWGYYLDLNFTAGRVTPNTGGADDDCNGLIVVAVVAGIAVAASIVMAILLALVIHKRWCGPGDYHYQERPKLNTMQSIGSTGSASSTTVLIKTDGENGDLNRNGTREVTYDHEPRSHI